MRSAYNLTLGPILRLKYLTAETLGPGAWAWGRGPGGRGPEPGHGAGVPRPGAKGPGPRGQSPSPAQRARGPGVRGPGPGGRDRGPGPGDTGPGGRGRGPGPGPGARAQSLGPGPRARARGIQKYQKDGPLKPHDFQNYKINKRLIAEDPYRIPGCIFPLKRTSTDSGMSSGITWKLLGAGDREPSARVCDVSGRQRAGGRGPGLGGQEPGYLVDSSSFKKKSIES